MAVETGAVAVITGGANGFGRALGDRCAELGYRVVLLDLDGDKAAEEASALAIAHGVEAIGLKVDVADSASVDAAAAAVEGRFGRADLVISNVSVQLFGGIERLTDAEYAWVLDVNVIGCVRVTRAFLPLLRAATPGRLVYTASRNALDLTSRMSVYQVSKFGIWGLAESMRIELADDGVEVATVFPGGMLTTHLASSESAQPDALKRPVGEQSDFEVMAAAKPAMVQELATAEDASRGVIEAVLAGEPYVITHGNLVEALETRHAELLRAAVRVGAAS